MANWDFVTLYNVEAEEWLQSMGLPHPARVKSRMPTTQQLIAAWESSGVPDAVLIDGFNWDEAAFEPDDGFRMRGDRRVQLRILKTICSFCGQLWMYPDTGEPAIIVDESLETGKVLRFHEECCKHRDAWDRFYRSQYAT